MQPTFLPRRTTRKASLRSMPSFTMHPATTRVPLPKVALTCTSDPSVSQYAQFGHRATRLDNLITRVHLVCAVPASRARPTTATHGIGAIPTPKGMRMHGRSSAPQPAPAQCAPPP